MRRKPTAKKASERRELGDADVDVKARDDAALRLTKPAGRATKTPAGKGLGKAGAKRLGRLLKRAIQSPEEPAPQGQPSLPKTPVRLFKHRVQTDNAPEANAASTRPASHPVSQLILSVVSQCKHRGGISMAELRQTLAAGGYDVPKNERRVKVATTRMVNDETLARTTRSATLRLNSKKTADATPVRTRRTVKPAKPNGDVKQSKAAGRSPGGAARAQRRAAKTPAPRGKPRTAKGRKGLRAAGPHRPRGNGRRAAGGSQRAAGRARRAAGGPRRARRRTRAARRKPARPAGRRRGSPTGRGARVQRARGKARSPRRRQPKRSRRKYSQKRRAPRRRLPKTRSRLKTQKRQTSRRTYYY